MIIIITSAFAVLCAAIILLRALCVLDGMTPRTRWSLKIVYALQAGGATSIVVSAFQEHHFSPGAVLLLAGVAAAHLYDRRIYPPRHIRAGERARKTIEGKS